MAFTRTVPLIEEFGPLAAPPQRVRPERAAAETEAQSIFARLIQLVAPEGVPDLEAFKFALQDLELAPPTQWAADEGEHNEDWYTIAEYAYDRWLVRPWELPLELGVDWDPYTVGDLILSVATESERFGGTVPDWLFEQQIADLLYPHPRWGRLALRVVPKETAYAFIREHHSALGSAKLPPGVMFALGAFEILPFARPRLVAVATAGHPTGKWPELLRDRPAPCRREGVLELTRIASIGGLYTTDRRGRRVPVNASSMLAARILDLLPLSGRGTARGCLFVTYSLPNERGSTYLALASKGLRPVGRTAARRKPTGARRGGTGAALPEVSKVRWEAGPAALPAKWSVLEGIVPEATIQRTRSEFEAWKARQRSSVTR